MKQVTIDRASNGFTARSVNSGKLYVFTNWQDLAQWLFNRFHPAQSALVTTDIRVRPSDRGDREAKPFAMAKNPGPSLAHIAPWGEGKC